MRYLIIIFFLFSLAACLSENYQQAAGVVSAIWQADESIIGYSTKADSDVGTRNTLELSLKNLKAIKPDYDKEKITSVSAISLLSNLDSSKASDIDVINIKIENNGEKYEKSYPVADLKNAINSFAVVDAFFSSFENRDFDKFKKDIDTKYVPDTMVQQFFDVMNQIDSTYGKINKTTITGFQYGTLEETKERVITAWSEVMNGEAYTRYTFYISPESYKIIFIKLN